MQSFECDTRFLSPAQRFDQFIKRRSIVFRFDIERSQLPHLLEGVAYIFQCSLIGVDKPECLRIENVDLIKTLFKYLKQMVSVVDSFHRIIITITSSLIFTVSSLLRLSQRSVRSGIVPLPHPQAIFRKRLRRKKWLSGSLSYDRVRQPETTPLSGRYPGDAHSRYRRRVMETKRTRARCINHLYASSENQLTALTDHLNISGRKVIGFIRKISADIVEDSCKFIILKVLKTGHIPVVLPGLLFSRYTVQKQVDQAPAITAHRFTPGQGWNRPLHT